mmetsp:Transcript_23909/g.57659  ORF Transcript_23909/g.57659 Transcript_23909/m.57659 type:complete len:559 (-) Transcript_23909:367-2043(-)
MRITLPSAAVVTFTGMRYPSIVSASASDRSSEAAADDNIIHHTDSAISRMTQDVNKSYESSDIRQRFIVSGEECNVIERGANPGKKTVGLDLTDVGILGCAYGNTCEPDGTSYLGGRCTAAAKKSKTKARASSISSSPGPKIPAFKNRRNRRTAKHKNQSPRFLQATSGVTLEGQAAGDLVADEEFVCPKNCPVEFCDCAEKYGSADECAAELHSVCERDLLAECVPNKWLKFYEETYCPFARCLAVENKLYEECSCGYYSDYCTVYYKYEQSIVNCQIGDCCKDEPAGNKFVCLPGMEPTASPTSSPSVSVLPSAFPTVTQSPTLSTAPTVSARPTSSPSISSAPTVSAAPTGNPTASPSGQPSVSVEPTTSPTQSPTLRPTDQPTVSPTVFPSSMPSDPPSDVPSDAPTTSSAPSISLAPSQSPTMTTMPTVSSAPSSTPTGSTSPSFPPSTSPTVSPLPSSSPSTSPPTLNPSVSPTKSPSVSPSKGPTKSPSIPDTENPTDIPPTPKPAAVELVGSVPISNTVPPPAPSGGNRSLGTMVASFFVGVGGALWLFV